MISSQNGSKLRIFLPAKNKTSSSRSIHQRFIITTLAFEVSSMTRGAIAKRFARRYGTTTKNAYSQVLMELQKSLIPSGIVEQEGTIQPMRGPLILQVNGIPCFRLTTLGLLIASCIDEISIDDRIKLLQRYLAAESISNFDELIVREQLLAHLREYPEFTLELVKHGASQFLEGRIDHPFDIIPRHKIDSRVSLTHSRK
jgi:hypothetical protein